MNIMFKSKKEKELYEDQKKLTRKFGHRLAKMITRRIQEMEAFESVGNLLDSKIGKGHFLKGEYDRCFALNLTGNYRIIVEPVYENDADLSRLDCYELKIVTILEVEDYHGS